MELKTLSNTGDSSTQVSDLKRVIALGIRCQFSGGTGVGTVSDYADTSLYPTVSIKGKFNGFPINSTGVNLLDLMEIDAQGEGFFTGTDESTCYGYIRLSSGADDGLGVDIEGLQVTVESWPVIDTKSVVQEFTVYSTNALPATPSAPKAYMYTGFDKAPTNLTLQDGNTRAFIRKDFLLACSGPVGTIKKEELEIIANTSNDIVLTVVGVANNSVDGQSVGTLNLMPAYPPYVPVQVQFSDSGQYVLQTLVG